MCMICIYTSATTVRRPVDHLGEVVLSPVGSGDLTWVNRLMEQLLSPAEPSSWPNMGFNQNVFLEDFFFL